MLNFLRAATLTATKSAPSHLQPAACCPAQREVTLCLDTETMAGQPTAPDTCTAKPKKWPSAYQYFLKEKENGRNFDDASKATYRTAVATNLSISAIGKKKKKKRREPRQNEENNSPGFTSPKKRNVQHLLLTF